jgi:pimeloyl-ACP methyl ester carboxylesterase
MIKKMDEGLPMAIQRQTFQHDGLSFSFLDTGPNTGLATSRDTVGNGRVLIALHAHLMEAATFAPLAAALAPEWRVIALDQRGQGFSSHAPTYTRADYLGDIAALFAHLGLRRAVLLGNSLGGVNAYQFAALHPQLVSALIVEDIGAEISDDISFILPWEGTFITREDLENRIGARFVPYFEPSFRQTDSGWKLAFEPREMVASQLQLCGDRWPDWLATDCPALLIRGRESRVTTAEHLQQMALRRPNTTLVSLNGGHVVHMEAPTEFISAVRTFLQDISG